MLGILAQYVLSSGSLASSCDKLQDNLALAVAKFGVAQDGLRKVLDDAVEGNQKAKQRFAELVCLKPEEAADTHLKEACDLTEALQAHKQAVAGAQKKCTALLS